MHARSQTRTHTSTHTHTHTHTHTNTFIKIPIPYMCAYAWNLFCLRQSQVLSAIEQGSREIRYISNKNITKATAVWC